MKEFPSETQAIKEIIDIGSRMYLRGFVAANDGNISCKIDEDTILTTPTGVSKGFMTPQMMVKMKLDGTVLTKGEYQPSSEVKMHIRVYLENPDVMSVTHAHPPVCTAFAVAGIPLDKPIITEAVVAIGSIPVAKYATPSTKEVPDSIAPFCKDYNGVMIANHGVLTWGTSLMEAFYRLESVEQYAKITMYTDNILHKSNSLCKEQIIPLIKMRERLGIKGGGEPRYSGVPTNDKDVMPNTKLMNNNADAQKVSKETLEALVKEAVIQVLKKLDN